MKVGRRALLSIIPASIAIALCAVPAAAQEICPPEGMSAPDENDPAVIGVRWPLARQDLVEAGFEIDVRPSTLAKRLLEEAVVIDWAIDTPVDDVNPLIAVVCLGAVVPDVRGRTEVEAEQILTSAGFQLAPIDQGRGSDWTVVDQVPAVGRLVQFGEFVRVVLEPPSVVVPDLTGRLPDEAARLLQDVDLLLGEVDGSPTARILTQDPPPGQNVGIGTVVRVVTEPPVPPTSDTTTSTPDTKPSTPSTTTDTPTTQMTPTTEVPTDPVQWPIVGGIGAGASALTAAVGALFVRRSHKRVRRRITTATSTIGPAVSQVEPLGEGEETHVVRVDTHVDPPADRVEEES